MIYADLIVVANFLIDGALLLATAWTRKLKVRVWRVVLASGFGSLYVLWLLFPGWNAPFMFVVNFTIPAIMVGIAFGFGRLQALLRNLAAFYLIALAVGGGIFGVYYLLLPPNIDEILLRAFRTPGSLGFIAIVFVLMIGFYFRVFRGAKQKEAIAAHMAEVEVRVNDFQLRCTGLVDTGNQLYDPLTKTPVMIVEAVLWKEMLPEGWLQRIQTSDVDQIIAAMGGEEFVWQDRLRIVPYRGVNRSTQFMLAIKPDNVKVRHANREWETGKVLIGFDGGTLSSDGSYQAIIHPMLLQE